MIKYIVFDFDGTLADTFEIIKEIAKSEIKGVSDKDFELLRDEGIKNLMKKKKIPIWELPKIVLNVTSKLKKKENIKLFPEMVDSIKILSKSYKIGIVSSNSEENIIQTLKKYNINNLFEFVYAQSSIFGKYLVLKKMCKKYQINPSEIVYVGDEDRDIIAAKKINLKVIAVTWGYNSEKRLHKENPDYLVKFPKQLIKVISNLSK
ncbi:MAG: HAD-IA family hydrolase [archaeon]